MKHPSTRTTARVLLGLVILTSTGWAVSVSYTHLTLPTTPYV